MQDTENRFVTILPPGISRHTRTPMPLMIPNKNVTQPIMTRITLSGLQGLVSKPLLR